MFEHLAFESERGQVIRLVVVSRTEEALAFVARFFEGRSHEVGGSQDGGQATITQLRVETSLDQKMWAWDSAPAAGPIPGCHVFWVPADVWKDKCKGLQGYVRQVLVTTEGMAPNVPPLPAVCLDYPGKRAPWATPELAE
jgi:hypothetical protein